MSFAIIAADPKPAKVPVSIPCKLLGDNKDKRFWRNIVIDPAVFEVSLPAYLEMKAFDFVDLPKKNASI